MGLKNAFPKSLLFFHVAHRTGTGRNPETASLGLSSLFCRESSSCAKQQQGGKGRAGGVWRRTRTPSLAVRPVADFLFPPTCWNHSSSSCGKASLLNTKNEWKTRLSSTGLCVTHSPYQLRGSNSTCNTRISLLWFQNHFSSDKSTSWK